MKGYRIVSGSWFDSVAEQEGKKEGRECWKKGSVVGDGHQAPDIWSQSNV